MEKLPKLSQLKWASIISFFKKPKVKAEGIYMEQSFQNIIIPKSDIAQYTQFIGFKSGNPLCFLYLLAQRAQTQLMIQPQFTIPIPGLVHLANNLEQFSNFNHRIPFIIKANIKIKPALHNGSIKPIAQVDFYQNNVIVATCTSTYWVKNKKSVAKKIAIPIESKVLKNQFQIDIPYHIGKSYATISGDANPIHTQKWFARLLGFHQPIVHGWYMVSKIVESIEELTKSDIKSININFKSPVYMPSTLVVSFQKNSTKIDFEAKSENKIAITGTLLAQL